MWLADRMGQDYWQELDDYCLSAGGPGGARTASTEKSSYPSSLSHLGHAISIIATARADIRKTPPGYVLKPSAVCGKPPARYRVSDMNTDRLLVL
jgi:hypothetical protein